MTIVALENETFTAGKDSLSLNLSQRANALGAADRSVRIDGELISGLTLDEYNILEIVDREGRIRPKVLASKVFRTRIEEEGLSLIEARHLLGARISHLRTEKLTHTRIDLRNDRKMGGDPRISEGFYYIIQRERIEQEPEKLTLVVRTSAIPRVDIDFETGDTWIKGILLKSLKLPHRRIMICFGQYPDQEVDEPLLREILDETGFNRKGSLVGSAVLGIRRMVETLRFVEIDTNALIAAKQYGGLFRYRLNADVYDRRTGERMCAVNPPVERVSPGELGEALRLNPGE